MPRYTIFIGNNCHADVVVDGVEQRPQQMLEARQDFSERGFGIGLDAAIGHFCALGASYEEGGDSHFTQEEIDKLYAMGEVNPTI